MTTKLPPISPGQILFEEFMRPMQISQSQIARDIDVPTTRIGDIIHGKRAITADTALRLGEYFGVSPQWWLNMQTAYDLELAEDNDWESKRQRIRPISGAAHTSPPAT